MPRTTPNLALYVPDVGEVNWGGDTKVNGNWDKLDAVSSGSAFGIPCVRNLSGNNNAGAPNTKYDLAADYVVLRNPTGGLIVVRAAPINSICDFGVNGANGLDTGAIATNTWYYFYFIWNGSVLAVLASLQGPLTGPALLPGGFTYWAFATAIRTDGSGNLLRTYVRGASVFYTAALPVVIAGSATVETAVGLAGQVPPVALRAALNVSSLAGTPAASALDMTLHLRVLTGVSFATQRIAASSGAAAVGAPGGEVWIPNIGLNFFYLWTVVAGTAPAAFLEVTGYVVPNGDS